MHLLFYISSCMVYGNPFYISVIAPIAAIWLVNTIILIIVMVKLHQSSKNKPMSDTVRVLSESRIAFACNILLGITWVFAFLAVGELTTFFQWLFCIFNSLQGFFFFIFYTLCSKNVRTSWSKELRTKDNITHSLPDSRSKSRGR